MNDPIDLSNRKIPTWYTKIKEKLKDPGFDHVTAQDLRKCYDGLAS